MPGAISIKHWNRIRRAWGRHLLLIAELYRVEKEALSLMAEERFRLRQLQSQPILEKLHNYLLEIQAEVLPKCPEGQAVRYPEELDRAN